MLRSICVTATLLFALAITSSAQKEKSIIQIGAINALSPSSTKAQGTTPKTSAAFTLAPLLAASNQFVGFVRFPAELNSNPGQTSTSLQNAQSIPMANNTAFFRDFFDGGQTTTSGAVDGDTIRAEIVDANGFVGASFAQMTFHTSLVINGQTFQNCWVGGGPPTCDATTLSVTWISNLQCAVGTFTMNFFYNDQIFFSGSFNILPQIEATRVPGDNANPIQGDSTDYNQLDFTDTVSDQLGHAFCRNIDSKGNVIPHSTHVCSKPPALNEQIATLGQLGCALTSAAMVLGYHGVITDPVTLNDFLSQADAKHPGQLLGFDSGGAIKWNAIGAYAATRGAQLAFDWNGSAKSLEQQVCSAGPSVISVKSGTHWVATFGEPADRSTWKLHDPNGGTSRDLSSTNPPYNNKFGATRSFTGANQTFVTNYGLSIRLHSPAELLLTNPSGERTGLDPVSGNSFQEDPKSSYDDISIEDDVDPTQPGIEEKELVVGTPPAGDYVLQVTGTDTGVYTLEFLGQDVNGEPTAKLLSPIPTAVGMVHKLVIHMNLANAEEPTVSGALVGNGPDADANQFLTFANPVRQASLVPLTENNFPLVIFYGATVDPTSFSASLNGTDVTTLFHPSAGTSEAVNIPLSNGVSSLTLQINGTNAAGQLLTDNDVLQFDVGGSAPVAPTALASTAVSDSQINLSWTASTSSGVTYSVFRSTAGGFTPSADNQIAAGLTATSFSDVGLIASTTYFYVVEAVDAFASSAASNQTSNTTLTPGNCSGVSSTIIQNFDGIGITAGNKLWFSSVAQVSGLGSNPATVFVRNSTITFTVNGVQNTIAVPDANLTFDPNATTATTTFDTLNNVWRTVVPASGLVGNVFLDGAEFLLANSLPEGVKNVTWSANFSTDTPGITITWKWAAAAYSLLGVNCTNTGPDFNDLAVKPVDDSRASQFQNSDHAGTPEEYKSSLVSGVTGGGSSSFTGSYSSPQSVTPVIIRACGTRPQPQGCI